MQSGEDIVFFGNQQKKIYYFFVGLEICMHITKIQSYSHNLTETFCIGKNN